MNNSDQSPTNILRIYLVPYALLLILFLLVIGGGGSWLYLSARHVQTELVTTHILDVIKSTIGQLEAEYGKNAKQHDLSNLSNKVVHLYSSLPHLRQISIRNRNKGYGVRLASNKQLVDVELKPLSPDQIAKANHQTLAHQLHFKDGPLFHITFDLTEANQDPVQVDIAFERIGLMEKIETSMQSLIHSIVIFSILSLVSLLFAIGLSVYIGSASHKMGARLQTIYHQAAMGNLAADMVHDLRNLLASIRANIKNLLIMPEETDEVVAEMDQDLMRLEGKLTDFLQLTKPRNELFTVVEFGRFMKNIVRQCNPIFKEKQQSLTVSIAPGIAKLPVMVESLTVALVNLLVNARNHAPENGHVWLRAHSTGTQLEIMVEDDGAGIDADVLPRIFDPFFTTRIDGHGLGLAIVQRIVKAHNGTVSALNRPEGGTRFMITLPVKQQNE
jgi:signal transduction histidine kinase